jgi:hypothetical protein
MQCRRGCETRDDRRRAREPTGGKPLTTKEKAQGYDRLLLPDLQWGASDRATVRALHNIGVRSFQFLGKSWVRVSMGTREEMAKLADALQALA